MRTALAADAADRGLLQPVAPSWCATGSNSGVLAAARVAACGPDGACYFYGAQSSVRQMNITQTLRSYTSRGFLCGVILLLGACGSTTFVSTWKAPDVHQIDPLGKKIAALVLSGDEGQRRSAEVYLANDLTIRGARGVAAYTLIGFDHPSVEYARQRFKEAGIEGVVVMRLV